MKIHEYQELTARNAGFLNADVQERIRNCRLLIAGCGLGSVVAEVAIRTGFTNLILADGDEVAGHNLNRQAFGTRDIGANKAQALATRLATINPEAHIEVCPYMLAPENIPATVGRADLIVDAVDFLDASAIIMLHETARAQGKFVLAPVAAGFGSAGFVFAPGGTTLRDLAGIRDEELGQPLVYSDLFVRVIERYADRMPSYVLGVLHKQLSMIRDRKPCPISQLCAGTYSAAALTISLAVRVLAGETVPYAPEMITYDPIQQFATTQQAA